MNSARSSALSVFHDRALVALLNAGRQLTDHELARAMQLANPTSVMADLDQRQLVRSRVHSRETRPWTWSYQLTVAGEVEALVADERAAAERRRLERRLEDADAPYQERRERWGLKD